MAPEINLGEKYRDAVTGAEGVATGKATYLHGDPRAAIEFKDSTGRPCESWYDQSRLESVDDGTFGKTDG